MRKQDRQGVRTAADLEQKYNFSAMQKAIKLHESGIYKTNKTLEDFINAVMRNFMEMKSELDAKAEIWFYSGVPTLENEPVSAWEDYSLHLGDLYYDTATGFGYRFKVEEDIYSWEQVTDPDTIYALALANSAKDTADNKRNVFVEQPIPPYSTGDLWLDDTVLYVCQRAKAEGEVYEKVDFITADKYADDTVTLQIGDVLNMIVEGGRVATELVLTDRMINAITDKFVITAPDGTTTIIKGGKMFLDAIFAQDITATGTISGVTLRGTDAEINKGAIGGFSLANKVLTVTVDNVYIDPSEPEITAITNHLNQSETLTGDALEASDLDASGVVDALDLLRVRRIILGIDDYSSFASAKASQVKAVIDPTNPKKLVCVSGTNAWGRAVEQYFGINGIFVDNVKAHTVVGTKVKTSANVDLDDLAFEVNNLSETVEYIKNHLGI